MKKIAVLLAFVLTFCVLAGCSGVTVVYRDGCGCETCPAGNAGQATTPETTAPTYVGEGAVKLGVAIVGDVADSENAVKAAYDVTVVAVTLDENGVISQCIIDSVSASVEFDATGTITSDINAPISTKTELGDSYGMVAWGGAKYEWYQQAGALAEFAVGKTVQELKEGAIDQTGRAPEGSDLASTATIYLGGYVAAIEKAAQNAKPVEAAHEDSLKLAIIPTAASSVSATADKAGTAQLDVDVAALTVNGDVITGCYIDSLQAKVAFDTTGTITTDLTAAPQTKNELGEAYGMVAWAGAKFEWNQQAENFADYVVGKTAAQVADIAVTEGKPADADLSASVTISIAPFQALIEKAFA